MSYHITSCHVIYIYIYTNIRRTTETSPTSAAASWRTPWTARRFRSSRTARTRPSRTRTASGAGKRDSIIHHHRLEEISETTTVLELKQKPPYTTPSRWWWWWWWWWCVDSVFRGTGATQRDPTPRSQIR